MKNLLIMLGVFGGLGLAACGGKVVVDGFPSGTGGQGGQSGNTTAFSATATTGGSFTTTGSFSTAAGSSSTKASSGGGCASCVEVLSGAATSDELCNGEPVGLFKELLDCACGKICGKACSDSFCISFTSMDTACVSCLSDSSSGCGFELLNCVNH